MKIMLIGFQNAGKTTIGKQLADQLAYEFMDTDAQLTQRYGMPVRLLYQQMGELNFRKAEQVMIETICQQTGNAVIALGGGGLHGHDDGDVKSKIKKLTTDSVIIYLSCTFATIMQRYQQTQQFPAFAKNEMDLRAIYRQRIHRYENLSDVTVRTDNKSRGEIVEEIRSSLG